MSGAPLDLALAHRPDPGALRFAQLQYFVSKPCAERDLAAAHERSPLPDAPDRPRVDAWLVQAYQRAWREDGVGR